jgi:hypothetical protein
LVVEVASRTEQAAKRAGLTLDAAATDALAALRSSPRHTALTEPRREVYVSGESQSSRRRVVASDAGVVRAVLAAAAAPNFMVARRESSWPPSKEKLIKAKQMDPFRTVHFSKLPKAASTPELLRRVIEHALHGRGDAAEGKQLTAGPKGKAAREKVAIVPRPAVVVSKTAVHNGQGLVEFAAEEEPAGAVGSGLAKWGAPLVDVPRGAKLLATIAEGKLYEMKLPNPFPAVVRPRPSPRTLP